MPELHVLRVFVEEDEAGGNPLGVFLDGPAVPVGERQPVARDLGFPETVFVDDAARGAVRIHTPAAEIPLAGHPLVGTAWLMEHRGAAVDTLRPPAGEVPTWTEGGLTWIRARPDSAPRFELRELPSAAEVDSHPGAGGAELLDVWAWEDERAGRVRARVFAPALGVEDDEATGSAAILLTAELGRPLTIHQGRGSQIVTSPGPGGTVDVGGRVVLVETRPYRLVSASLEREQQQ